MTRPSCCGHCGGGLDEFLLLGPALEALIGNAGLGDLSLGVIDESLRLLLDEGQEVHAAHFETTIDPAVEMLVTAEGQMALEMTRSWQPSTDTIEAANFSVKFVDMAFYSQKVLLLES